jgi:SNF2 family DNA or RNA helicase
MFDLVRRRKAVLKLAQRAGQVYEQSAGLQRSAQERALLAKVAANPLRAGFLGSSSAEDIALLVALDRVNQTRSILNVSTNELESLIRKTRPHVGFLDSHVRFVRNLLSAEKRKKLGVEIAQAEGGLEIAQRLIDLRLTQQILDSIRNISVEPNEVLRRFQQNSAAFIAAFEQLKAPTETHTAGGRGRFGDVPNDIANRVEMSPLDQGPLRASLRRYQDFGARYLIVQRRTLLGDDMGLGKTVQVLAAMCHLHANGRRHFFVVAPNSVLVNWQREVTKHTELSSYLAHGAEREQVIKQWVRHGGVAITSYSTLSKLLPYLTAIDFLAVDEAHYAKNPEAKRTMAIEQIAKRSTYVSLMTGTALENKVEELHNLLNIASPGAVRELQPMLLANRAFDRAGVAKKIAHVYLRRTQADVLTELPERIEVDEWVTLTEEDREIYNSQPTNIMLKRRSATVTQAKFERLQDLVTEHRQADRKVVVYSFFRQVLDEVSEMFGNCKQLTGDSSTLERQQIIDTFTNTEGHAVLAAQIDAGGIGINLQAASVVILMEAQFKPSTEWQAIARVHRMGQSRTVNVHRILAANTIEEHLVNLIEEKANLFMAYAHESAIKDSSQMASDPGTGVLERELMRLLEEEQ